MKRKKDVKVCIVGGGKIGGALAQQLSGTGCEVTVIDRELAVVNRIANALDVISYQGNGASYTILQEVSAGEADIFIAVTGSDELNILSCLTAHMMGAKHTIARIRNVEYAQQSEFYMDRLGLSMTINPEFAAAREIQRLLHFPLATRIELFARGRAELVEMKVEKNNRMIGRSLMEINKGMGINLLICAVVRDNKIEIPNGDFTIQEGDVLYITGAPKEFNDAFKKMNLSVKSLDSVLIAGASRVGHYLANLLDREGANVTVVEKNHDVASELAGNIPGISVMCGDAMEYFDSMSDADIKNTDALVALTNNDEYNLVISMYAESKHIDKVITKMNSQSTLRELQKKTNICNISKEDAATDLIIGYARSLMAAEDNDAIESLYRLMDGKIEFIEFKVRIHETFLDKPLKELELKNGILIACIIRERKPIIPRGDDVIKNGDSVLIVSVDKRISRLQDIFKGQ